MFFAIFVSFLYLFSSPVLANNEFSISQNLIYKVSNLGTAQVDHEINLTNNISQIYAKEYQINISNTIIENLKGNDKFGDIINNFTTLNGNSQINLKFVNPTIGKDKTNQFFLNYAIPNFAKKKGNTWEIQFPSYDKTQDSKQINITILVPNDFGELSFSSIPTGNTHQIGDKTQIQFNHSQLKNKILLVFGNHQLFDFKLNYYLENKGLENIITHIPIPPNTNYQTITYENIDPPPTNIKSDNDGNWLAEYTLTPNQEINITVQGQAKIHPIVHRETQTSPTSQTDPQNYWPTTDPRITSIVQHTNTPKSIYRYVVDNLNYNYSLIDFAQRQGAISAIQNPNNALCTEFTDLFITLARAANIPAREIEGYAYSNNSKIKPTNINSDILHAWPEYYDHNSQKWLQIDPTWEKTTNGIDYFSDLDLNHLTFVIHGLNSSNPPPPGSYKKDNSSKSVFVDFATKSLDQNFVAPTINIDKNKIIIFNPNLYQIKPFIIKLKNINWSQQINSMIPLEKIIVDLPNIPFWKQALPIMNHYNFILNIPDQTDSININIKNNQHYLYLSFCLGGIIIILSFGGIILTSPK